VNALSREREEMEARVRIVRVDFVWIAVRVVEAWVAEGRRARVGRRSVRVYDTPCKYQYQDMTACEGV
jgi:hypothetical protein